MNLIKILDIDIDRKLSDEELEKVFGGKRNPSNTRGMWSLHQKIKPKWRTLTPQLCYNPFISLSPPSGSGCSDT